VQPGDRLEVRDKLGEKPGVTIFIGLDATLSMTTDREEELRALLNARRSVRNPVSPLKAVGG
jgi:hypothetical protein